MKWFMSILVGVAFSLALGFSLASVDDGLSQMIKVESVEPFILIADDAEEKQDDGNNTIAGGNATA